MCISRHGDEREDKAAQRNADRLVEAGEGSSIQGRSGGTRRREEWDYAARSSASPRPGSSATIREAKEALSHAGDALYKQCRAAYDPAKKRALRLQIINELDTQLGLLRDTGYC